MPPRILLADDSPHAQRMGERILREEGFEVVTVTDGATVLHRLGDVDPDVVLLDAFLTGRSGYELCRLIKADAKHGRAGVILVAGLLEPVSEDEAKSAGADAVLKKPFEATAVINAVRPLIERARTSWPGATATKASEADEIAEAIAVLETEAPAPVEPAVETPPPAPVETPVEPPSSAITAPQAAVNIVEQPAAAPVSTTAAVPEPSTLDPEIVRAAVTIALERAFPSLVDEIARKVIDSLPSSDGSSASNKV